MAVPPYLPGVPSFSQLVVATGSTGCTGGGASVVANLEDLNPPNQNGWGGFAGVWVPPSLTAWSHPYTEVINADGSVHVSYSLSFIPLPLPTGVTGYSGTTGWTGSTTGVATLHVLLTGTGSYCGTKTGAFYTITGASGSNLFCYYSGANCHCQACSGQVEVRLEFNPNFYGPQSTVTEGAWVAMGRAGPSTSNLSLPPIYIPYYQLSNSVPFTYHPYYTASDGLMVSRDDDYQIVCGAQEPIAHDIKIGLRIPIAQGPNFVYWLAGYLTRPHALLTCSGCLP